MTTDNTTKTPRVFTDLPDAVLDRDGEEWTRIPDTDKYLHEDGSYPTSFYELLTRWGPLTEVSLELPTKIGSVIRVDGYGIMVRVEAGWWYCQPGPNSQIALFSDEEIGEWEEVTDL